MTNIEISALDIPYPGSLAAPEDRLAAKALAEVLIEWIGPDDRGGGRPRFAWPGAVFSISSKLAPSQ